MGTGSSLIVSLDNRMNLFSFMKIGFNTLLNSICFS
ncbi:MAG: hypothetical protein JWO58_343 [Chitinophagaceae bacterium]|nr:hypothetical protein [Chitinophagaceae bacterium]